jgi:predicted dehydrogenase
VQAPSRRDERRAVTSDRIGVGIIGLSADRGWGATAHLPALRSLPDYEVVALSTTSRASAEAAGAAHGVPLTFGDARELAQSPDVDLVAVAVKVPFHRELVSIAVEAGKPVLCEWPLANGLEEAEWLADRAFAHGVRGFVGLQARSAPPVRFVRDLVASGEIGEVLSTTLVGSGDQWGATVHPTGVYLLDRDNGATMLTIPFGHAFDALCWSLGEPTELSAVTATRRPTVRRTDTGDLVAMTAEDQVAVAGVLPNGAVASIQYRGGRSPGTNFLWQIDGSSGTVVLTGGTGHLQYGRVQVQTAAAGERSLTARAVPPEYEAVAHDPEQLSYTIAQAYARLAVDLREGTGSVPGFDDAVVRHRALDAVQRSAATGERVAYDHTTRGARA